MLKIEQMLMLKIKQLFANIMRLDWIGSPYAVILLESFPYDGILTQYNVKLAAGKWEGYVQRYQTKSANEGIKKSQQTKVSSKAGRKRREGSK